MSAAILTELPPLLTYGEIRDENVPMSYCSQMGSVDYTISRFHEKNRLFIMRVEREDSSLKRTSFIEMNDSAARELLNVLQKIYGHTEVIEQNNRGTE